MQVLVYYFGHLPADAVDLGELRFAGAEQLLAAAEMAQQLAPPGRADAGNAFQERGLAGLGASAAVAGDGEAVSFVAHLLQQVQGRGDRVQAQFPGLAAVAQDQGFLAGAAADAFGDGEQGDVFDVEFLEHFRGAAELAFAAVDEREVGHFAFAGEQARETPLQRLFHGGVIVSRGDGLDVEAPVVAFGGAVFVEDDGGGDGFPAGGVADVVAFEPGGDFFQFQGALQEQQAAADVLPAGEQGFEGLARVGAGHFQPAGAMAAHPGGEFHLAFGDVTQRGFDLFRFGGQFGHDHLARHEACLAAGEVHLGDEGGDDVGGVLREPELGEMAFRIDDAPCPHVDDVDAGVGLVEFGGDDVGVAALVGDDLLVLDAAQSGDAVADDGGLLELFAGGGGFHVFCQLGEQPVALAFEEQLRIAHLFGVFLLRDEADAGRGAALDLVLQAGPGAVAVIAVLALAHLEDLLQHVEAVPGRMGAGVRAVKDALAAAAAAVEGEPGEVLVFGEQDVGVGLVVAQLDVVGGPVPLDQRLFEQQRLGFAVGDGDFDAGHLVQHGEAARVQGGAAEIAAHAVAQVGGLADVDDLAGAVLHLVHPGPAREAGDVTFVIEGGFCRHGKGLHPFVPLEKLSEQ